MNFTQAVKPYVLVLATVTGIASTFITHSVFSMFGCIFVGLIVSGICSLKTNAVEKTAIKQKATLADAANTPNIKRKSTTMYIVNPNTANCFPGMNIGGHTNFL